MQTAQHSQSTRVLQPFLAGFQSDSGGVRGVKTPNIVLVFPTTFRSLSEWGLVAMALLLIGAASFVLARRQRCWV